LTSRPISLRVRTKVNLQLLLFVSILAFAGLSALLVSPAASAQGTASVTIKNFSFNSGSITVVIGVNNTVTWTNQDAVTHTVTSDNGSFGGSVPPGATFTHTFTTAGFFGYHCSIHTFMKGTVKVLAESSSSSSLTTDAVPEFPFAAVGVVLLTGVLLFSYLTVRKMPRNK